MQDKVYVGYINSFVGLKGEVKIISNEKHQDIIFAIGNSLIIDNKDYIIESSRLYKNNYIITLKGYENINLINDLLKKEIFINRNDLNLKKNEYLYSDLKDMSAIYNNKNFGKVTDILYSKFFDYIKVNNILIPINDHFVENIDINKKILYLKNIGELNEN